MNYLKSLNILLGICFFVLSSCSFNTEGLKFYPSESIGLEAVQEAIPEAKVVIKVDT